MIWRHVVVKPTSLVPLSQKARDSRSFDLKSDLKLPSKGPWLEKFSVFDVTSTKQGLGLKHLTWTVAWKLAVSPPRLCGPVRGE